MLTGIVILAAGKGSRLNLGQPKPLTPFLGQPLISHLLDVIPSKIPYFLIISPDDFELFNKTVGHHPYLFQDKPLGTGHAISSQYEKLKHFDQLIILNADTPLVPTSLILELISCSHDTLVGFHASCTKSYGQILEHNHKAIQVIEQKDRESHLSNLCYSGIMKISQDTILAITKIPPSPITNEYYITHIVSKDRPFDIILHDERALQGINTFEEYLQCETLYKQLCYQRLLQQGITLNQYESLTFLNTTIGHHCQIDAQVSLKNSQIGMYCHIGQGSILDNVVLKDHVTILPYSILSNCSIDAHSTIGPFAHIQEKTHIGKHVCIGNFVEIKRSIIANYVKAKHLSYLGDAYIDTYANIGAGTITCNYVPWRKEKAITYIGSHSLIGANSLLIAPCHIGPYTICAAGSVIQGYILPKQLAISRATLSTRRSLKLSHLESPEG